MLETKNPEKQSCCSCWYKCYISSAWEDWTIWNTLCLWKSISGNMPQRVKFQGANLAYLKKFHISNYYSEFKSQSWKYSSCSAQNHFLWKVKENIQVWEISWSSLSVFESWNDETPKGSAAVRSNSVFLRKLSVYCSLTGTDSRDGNVLLGWINPSGSFLVHSRAFQEFLSVCVFSATRDRSSMDSSDMLFQCNELYN